MTAHDIRALLHIRHQDDLLIEELYSGSPKMDAGCGKARMDAWVMTRSWANPRYICYEIKVSRSDFMQDNKWPEYLGACTEFYFAVAPGVMDPKECPDEAGMLVATTNGGRLICKKKAPKREPDYHRIFNVIKSAMMRDSSDCGSPLTALNLLERGRDARIGGKLIGNWLANKHAEVLRKESALKSREEAVEMYKQGLLNVGIRWHDPYRSRPDKYLIQRNIKDGVELIKRKRIPKEIMEELRGIKRAAECLATASKEIDELINNEAAITESHTWQRMQKSKTSRRS